MLMDVPTYSLNQIVSGNHYVFPTQRRSKLVQTKFLLNANQTIGMYIAGIYLYTASYSLSFSLWFVLNANQILC